MLAFNVRRGRGVGWYEGQEESSISEEDGMSQGASRRGSRRLTRRCVELCVAVVILVVPAAASASASTAAPEYSGGHLYRHATFTGDGKSLAPDLQGFFKGLGTSSETWSGVLTQVGEWLLSPHPQLRGERVPAIRSADPVGEADLSDSD